MGAPHIGNSALDKKKGGGTREEEGGGRAGVTNGYADTGGGGGGEGRAEGQGHEERKAALNVGGPTQPSNNSPAEICPRAPRRGLGNGKRVRACLGGARGDAAYGDCRGVVQLRHRAGRFPSKQGRYVLHAPCVVEASARVANWHHSAAQ